MILGIGVDIAAVSRFHHWLKDTSLLQRYFHPEELAVVLGRPRRREQALAARFAAKEAFGKALGTGMRGFHLRNVEVFNNRLGRPELRLHDDAYAHFSRLGPARALLSLSHETEYAVAMVVIERIDG